MVRVLVWLGAGVALVALGAGALWLAPRLLEADRLAAQVETQVAHALGQPVTHDGPVRVRLLPRPRLTLTGVRVGAPGTPLLTARQVDVRLAPGPLLTGRARPAGVTLSAGTVLLGRDTQGRTTWQPTQAVSRGPTAGGPLGTFGGSGDSDGPAMGPAPPLPPITVRDFTLRYANAATGTRWRLTALDGTLTGDTPRGSYQLALSGGLGAHPVTVDGRLGQPSQDRLPLRLTLGFPDSNGQVRLAGIIGTGKDDPRRALRGRLTIRTDDAAPLGLVAGLPLIKGLSGTPLTLSAPVTVTSDALTADDLRLTLGDTRFQGTGQWRFREDLSLDLEATALKLAGLPDFSLIATTAEANPLHLPPDLAVRLKVAARALQVPRGLIRAPVLDATWTPTGVTLRDLSATLPGGTRVALTARGQVHPGATPALTVEQGALSVTAPDLRSTLSWLGLSPTALRPERLRRAELSARLRGTLQALHLENLTLGLDGSTFRGGVVARLTGRPGVGLTLRGDRFNLDAYRPTEGLPTALPWLDRFDARADLRLEEITVGGVVLQDAALEGRLDKGTLTLAPLTVARAAGARLRLEGAITDVGTAPHLDGLHLTLSARRALTVLRQLGLEPPLSLVRDHSLTVEGTLDGPLTQPILDGTVALGPLHVAGKGTFTPADRSYDGLMTLDHPDMLTLIQGVAPGYQPLGETLGPVSLAGDVRLAPGNIALGALSGRAGPLPLRGEVAWRHPPGLPTTFAVELTTGDIPLDALLPPERKHAPGLPPWPAWDLSALPWGTVEGHVRLGVDSLRWRGRRFSDARLDLTLTHDRLRLDPLSLHWPQGGLTVSGQLRAPAGRQSARLRGQASLDGYDLRGAVWPQAAITPSGGRLTATLSVESRGSRVRDWLAGAEGSGSVILTGGVLLGLDPAALTTHLQQAEGMTFLPDPTPLAAPLLSGHTPLESLAAPLEMADGILTLAPLAATLEGAMASGDVAVTLVPWRLDGTMAVTLTPPPVWPPVTVHLEGPVALALARVQAEALWHAVAGLPDHLPVPAWGVWKALTTSALGP